MYIIWEDFSLRCSINSSTGVNKPTRLMGYKINCIIINNVEIVYDICLLIIIVVIFLNIFALLLLCFFACNIFALFFLCSFLNIINTSQYDIFSYNDSNPLRHIYLTFLRSFDKVMFLKLAHSSICLQPWHLTVMKKLRFTIFSSFLHLKCYSWQTSY